MAKRRNIGSHIIPRFYLEQFSSPSKLGKDKPGRLWVYERGKSPDERSTTVQGVENGYFEFTRPDGIVESSFEDYLGRREAECNDVLASAKSDLFDWSAVRHRIKLAFYCALLFLRATQRRTWSAARWDRLTREYAEALADEDYLSELARFYQKRFPNESVTPDRIRTTLLDSVRRWQEPTMEKRMFVENLLANADAIKGVLLEKPWQVWKAPADSEFVTSDNPFVTFIRVANDKFNPGHGFRQPGVVAAFPLSPNACLVMGAIELADSIQVVYPPLIQGRESNGH